MNILLIGNHDFDGVNSRSMTLFSELLYQGLSERGHKVRHARPAARFWQLSKSQGAFGKWCKYLDQFLLFPFDLWRLRRWADVVHVCDHSNATLLSYLGGKPTLVTCHDVIGLKRGLGLYAEEQAFWTGRLLQRWTARNLRRAGRIACVSGTVQRELVALLGLGEGRAGVVYNGLNHPYAPMAKSLADGVLGALGVPLDRPFILHVGSDEWKKNRRGVVDAFAELRKLKHPAAGQLIFAGARLEPELKRYVDARGLSAVVRALGQVSAEPLCALYSWAALLLFPSLYEGFGWPIIEAQACGCLVATSNRNPMSEVGGPGVIAIDPEDPAAAARTIAGFSPAEQDAIRQRGWENARRFSTAAMIDGYVKAYENIAKEADETAVATGAMIRSGLPLEKGEG